MLQVTTSRDSVIIIQTPAGDIRIWRTDPNQGRGLTIDAPAGYRIIRELLPANARRTV